ncbi:MAG: hypothetical protein JNJ81_11655 [Candidatus Accumulibacter sp.]|nr:hypothetical protein [Accumulibacter sp.]
METIIIKSNAVATTTTNEGNKPWYDRMTSAVDGFVDHVKEVVAQRAEIKEIAKVLEPLKAEERKARARANAVAWAKTQGYDVKFED